MRIAEFRIQKSEDRRRKRAACRAAFTLVELLASLAVLGIMLALLFSALNQGSKAWLQGESRVETFTEARALLELMSRDLAQAVVSSYVPFFASCDNIAFVAPLSDDPARFGVDLMEVVYRPDPDAGANYRCDTNRAPFRVVRKLTPAYTNTASTTFFVGAWDFYSNARDWPETAVNTLSNVVADGIIFLEYKFYSLTNSPESTLYWTSRPPLGTVWREIGGGAGINIASSTDTFKMTNKPPAGVRITLRAVDSRAMARMKLVPVGTPAWSNIWTEAAREFTTYVAIPSRLP